MYVINYQICEKDNALSCANSSVFIVRNDGIYTFGNGSKTVANQMKTKKSLNPFTISPNPSDGVFTIVFANEVKDDTTIEVYDNWGRKIINRLFTNQKEYVLSMTNYAAGSYLLKISNEEQTDYKKIIINQ